jgi:hypothetical protein
LRTNHGGGQLRADTVVGSVWGGLDYLPIDGWMQGISVRAILLGMATYKIIPRSDGDGFDVEVIGADGVHNTMLGFKTEADAQEWIAQDQSRGDRTEVC